MNELRLLFVAMLCLGAACTSGFHIPDGDAAAGRIVFEKMQCYQCHQVAGETFPPPAADPPLPFVLGVGPRKSREYLAESILAPSHRFAKPPPGITFGEPSTVEPREYEGIREGELSRMGDYSETLTLRQWIDLTAYLESIPR
jgi:L-cysteine S-thiosulfotransferase